MLVSTSNGIEMLHCSIFFFTNYTLFILRKDVVTLGYFISDSCRSFLFSLFYCYVVYFITLFPSRDLAVVILFFSFHSILNFFIPPLTLVRCIAINNINLITNKINPITNI